MSQRGPYFLEDEGKEGPVRFTVVIPAHNEAAVIAETLHTMIEGAPAGGEPEVIVVCNGCSDDTAHVARAAAPRAKVLEIAIGSKPAALNLGLSHARFATVLLMDADVRIDHHSLAAVAEALREPGVMAASPAADLRTEGCDPLVRAHYRVWRHHPYLREGVGGSGVVGLSRAGIERLGEFPPIIADDTYIRSRVPLSQQKRVFEDENGRPVRSKVLVPKRIGSLIACESRWRSGDVELLNLDPSAAAHPGVGAAPVRQLWAASGSIPDLAIYYGVKVAGRLLHWVNRRRGRAGRWHRDESRRRALPG